MPPTIRLAHPDESAALHDLVQRAYGHYVERIGGRPMPMDDDYGARVAAGEAWVLEEAGAVRGVLVLEEHADHLLLYNVAVEPARRGQGDGRILLDFAEAEARRRGLPEVRLYTNELMERNIALYAARGYAEAERRREKGFCRVFMAKRLNRA